MMSEDSVLLNENDQLACSCADIVNQDNRLAFATNRYHIEPTHQPWWVNNDMVFVKSYDNNTILFKKNKMSFGDEGYYACHSDVIYYDDIKDVMYNRVRIYVWIKTKKSFFSKVPFQVTNEIVISPDGSHLQIPCVPTSPCYDDVKLFKDSEELKINKTNGIAFDPREGFMITNRNYTYASFNFTCSITMYGRTETKKRSFVTRAPKESYGILFRSHIIIPCVPTSPCFDVKLFEGSQEVTINETNGIKFDPRQGFLITNPSYIHVPIDFTCSVTVESLGRTDTVKYQYTKFNDEDTAILNENDQLVCTCSNSVNQHGNLSFRINLYGIYPGHEPWTNYNDMIFEESYDNKTITLRKNKISFGDEGYYGCHNEYYDKPYSDVARMYIWVKTKKSFFSKIPFQVTNGIVISPSDSHLQVPCVPTSPCYDMKLFKDSEELKINKTNGIAFDPREGFMITNLNYIYAPINFTCSITMYGRTEKVLYHYKRLSEVVIKMVN
ncbi:hypothetical protein HCN44_003714 [Aphidius gifuensis]|uniref:Uncharacterized protein n=1 Tax=Aphidius gifuensis TaxID=684658 RepID=A0A834XIY9_APHGI|nr:hypothetical protein HCN44_003714 [Aphidius gifuensis]